MTYKTTKKDFREFKKWCEYYLDKFSCRKWKAYYEHRRLSNLYFAQASQETDGFVVTLTLNTELSEIEGLGPDWTPRITAKHEILHLVLSSMINENLGKKQRDFEEEAVIHILERLL